FRIPFARECPRRCDLFRRRGIGCGGKIVRMPRKVAAIAMAVPEITALAPEVRLVEVLVPLDVGFAGRRAVERIDDAERRTVGHRLGERAIEKIELRVVMMPREIPTI